MNLRPRLGVCAHLLNDETLWAAASTLGVTYARLDLNWIDAAPSLTERTWDVLDRAVNGAFAHGFEIYASIGYSPAWSNHGAGRGRPPTSIMDWEAFVQEVGERYHAKIRFWGIWNEFQGSVREYTDYLFLPACQILKSINPNNTVCGPEMATEGAWASWLTEFLARAGPHVDVISLHAYADTGASVWEKLTRPRRWYEVWKDRSILEVIERAGYGAKPCWLTETGWATSKVGEEGQVHRWDQLLERYAMASWPHVLFAYQLIDELPPDRDPVTWGLFWPDGSAKRSADVIRRYTGRGVV